MNYVKHLSIALLVICAVPTAFAADPEFDGFEVDGKFYEKSALQKHTDDKKVETHYIVGEDCVQHKIDDPKATTKYTLKDSKYEHGNSKLEAGKTPKYAVTDFKGDAIDPSFFFKVNQQFHALGDWSKKGVKAGVAAIIPGAVFAAYHLSPAAKKKMNELYAKVCKVFTDAKEDNTARMKAAAIILGTMGGCYGVYTYGDDVFYKATMIDPNYFDAYKKA